MSSAGWSSIRAKNLYRVVDTRAGDARPPLLAVSIHHGVVPREFLTYDEPRADDLSNYKLCNAGDIVLNRMRAFQGAIGISGQDGLVSPDYLVLRVKPEVNARFLHHLFRSTWFVGEMISRLRGIGSTEQGNVRTPRINAEDLGDICISLPPSNGQHAIAEYLDAETARIDAVIAKKQRLIELIGDHLSSVRETIFIHRPQTHGVPLRHLTDQYRPIVYGIVQAGPEVPDGIPYIKSGDLPELNVDLLGKTSPEIHRQYLRARVIPGDIIMAMRASIGTVAVVPPDLPEANLTQGTARIAPCNDVDPCWLYHVLQTYAVREECNIRAVGTTFRTLNIWDLRRIAIPVVPKNLQARLARTFEAELAAHSMLSARLVEQVRLLREHRQALITTTIRGELEIATQSN